MTAVCVVLANGFEEIEATTIIDVLRRAEVEVHLLGAESHAAVGAHAITIQADQTIDEEHPLWDALILPGGLPGAHTLRDHPEVQALIRKHAEGGKILAAICAAPIALGKAGVLHGKQATCYPGFENELQGASPSEERVVQDGNIITSRGPGTAMEFALTLVAELCSPEIAGQLREGMLVQPSASA